MTLNDLMWKKAEGHDLLKTITLPELLKLTRVNLVDNLTSAEHEQNKNSLTGQAQKCLKNKSRLDCCGKLDYGIIVIF